jgi:hypothetical protein
MKWDEVCRKVHDAGLTERIKMGLAYHSGIPVRLRMFDEACKQVSMWESKSGLDEQARIDLRLLMGLMPTLNPTAVAFQTDTWMCRSKEFAERFDLNDLPPEKFMDEYSRILNEKYEGHLANVPADLRSDAIVTMLKGPQIKQISLFTLYHNENDGVVMEETQSAGEAMHMSVMPDWWPVTIN